MPKGGPLDRCHDHVKESLEKKGMSEKKADGVAWGICKKKIDGTNTTVVDLAKHKKK